MEQAVSQDAGLLVLNRLDKQRILNAYSDKEREEWRGIVYPSSLEWGICYADYIYNKASKNKTDFGITIKGEERMEIGTLRHQEWSDLILKTRLLYGKPNYPDFVLKRMEAKKKSGDKVREYPEIAAYCPHWGISGYADAVIKDKGKPWVVDFKTKNYHPISKWDVEKTKYPSAREECQLYVYTVIFDKYQTFDQKIAGIRLCYYNNPAFGHDKIDPRYEYSAEIDPIKYKKTIKMLDEIRIQVLRCFCQMPFVCSYQDCRKCHGSDSSRINSSKELLP